MEDIILEDFLTTTYTLTSRLQGLESLAMRHDLRQELCSALQRLFLELLNEGQIAEYYLSTSMDITYLKIAVDLKVFQYLNDAAPASLGVATLSSSVGADPRLVHRLLAGLAAIHAVDQTDDESFRANKVTKTFTAPKGVSGVNLIHDFSLPAIRETPHLLTEIGYANPSNITKLPFHSAYGKRDFFPVLSERPKTLKDFETYMRAHREGRPVWLDSYHLDKRILDGAISRGSDGSSDGKLQSDVTIVDIGGSQGHELIAMKQKFPEHPLRLILQDLPATINQLPPDHVAEVMVHDFFQPQPIRGARLYYLRNVLHDWDDEKCRLILENVRNAMKPGYSKVIINEFVLPARGASLFATHSDFTVMALSGAMERTEQQWRQLLDSVGLTVDLIWTIGPNVESILEAGLQDVSET